MDDEKHRHRGIRITGVSPLSAAAKCLKPEDVLLAIDGAAVAQDATIELPERPWEVKIKTKSIIKHAFLLVCKFLTFWFLCKFCFLSWKRVPFDAAVTRHCPGTEVPITILRNGSEITQSVKIEVSRRLVPIMDGFDCFAQYYIVGGLVFIPLTLPWAEHIFSRSSNTFRVAHFIEHIKDSLPEEQKQIVVLGKILAHSVNIGYHEGYDCSILKTFNGKKIHNIQDLKTAVEKEEKESETCQKSHMMEFRLQHHAYNDELLVILDTKKAVEAQEQILKMNLIATRQRFTDVE